MRPFSWAFLCDDEFSVCETEGTELFKNIYSKLPLKKSLISSN
jgi:hypothetical protein